MRVDALHRLAAISILVAAALFSDAAHAQPSSSPFTETVGFATKVGFRGVFAWKSTRPVEAYVEYGTSPTALTGRAEPTPNPADTAGMAIAEGLTIGSTYYFRVVDRLTGAASPIASFEAKNAYNDWNGSTYTLDLLVQLDTQSLPPDVPHDQAMADIAAGINIFAERVYDALDGYARLGRVIITDTNLQYAANIPAQPVPPSGTVPCPSVTNLGDVLIQTTVPFDSHTYGGWSVANPCVQFYVGRIGQLVVPWEDEYHFGYVSTHEMMHYAFNTPDLYPEAPNGGGGNCKNLDWDGSVMHNTGGFNNGKWEATELDRNPTLTPCVHGSNPWSWDALRARYTNIPLNSDGPIDHMFEDKAKGNADGGALEIWILDREPGGSTLTRYTPEGEPPVCGSTNPQVNDEAGDATIAHLADTGYINEPSLDVTKGYLTWDAAKKAVVFHVKVTDLTDLPPAGGTGHRFRFFFEYAGKRYQLRADRATGVAQARNLYASDGTTLLASGLAGAFDINSNEITIVVPSSVLASANPSAPRLEEGAEMANFEIIAYRLTNVAGSTVNFITDIARGTCTYFVNQENFGPNSAPTAVADAATTAEDTPVTIHVVANDTDPDGDTLVVRTTGPAANGSVTISEGTVVYTPKANFSGTDSFTYTASDRKGGTSSASVQVTITAAPDAPTAVGDTAVATPGSTITIGVLANDTDPDGDSLSLVSVSTPRAGTASHDGHVVTYRAPAGFSGSDAFTYTIVDSTGRSSVGNVTVTAVACLSTFTDDFEPAPESGWTAESSGGLPAVGNNPAAAKWTLVTDPLAHSPVSSWFSDTSDLSPNKDDKLTSPSMRLTSASKLSFWHRFGFEDTYDGGILEVSLNGGPFVEITSAGGAFEKGGYNGNSSAHGRAAWTGTQPAMAEVVVNLGAFGGKTARVRWRTKTDANTGSTGWFVDDVTFTGLASSSCAAPNRAPEAADDNASAASNSAVAVAVLANDVDPDGDPIKVTAAGPAANGSVTHDGTSVTYTPAAGFAGTDSFTYTVSDTFGGSDTATVTVVVNGPPTAADDNARTNEDQPVTIDATANDSDPNGDTLTVVAVGAASNGTARTNGDGSVSYSPKANFNGTDSFTYTVSDGRGGQATATIRVTIAAVNDTPNAAADSATTARNTAVNINVLANDRDPDGDTLRVVSVTPGTSRSAVSINTDGTVRYKPRPGFVGSDTFSYTVSDGNGGVSTATVSVTVNP